MKGVFIKLGGSLITDKSRPMHLKKEVLNNVCAEIASAMSHYPEYRFVLGNGAGSFGHYSVQKTGWSARKDDATTVSAIKLAVGELHEAVLHSLTDNGVPALSFPPSTFTVKKSGRYAVTADPLIKYAGLGAVPVVCGDVVFDKDEGSAIMSTEDILEEIMKLWLAEGHSVKAVLYLTSSDGVLDPAGKTIKRLSSKSRLNNIHQAEGYDVTGGMLQKVMSGFAALSYTPTVWIVNGQKPNEISKALTGTASGTRLVSG